MNTKGREIMSLLQILWIVAVVLLLAIGWLRYKVGASHRWYRGDLSWKLDGWFVVLSVTLAAEYMIAAATGRPYYLLAYPVQIAVTLLAEHLGKLHPLPDPDPRPAGV